MGVMAAHYFNHCPLVIRIGAYDSIAHVYGPIYIHRLQVQRRSAHIAHHRVVLKIRVAAEKVLETFNPRRLAANSRRFFARHVQPALCRSGEVLRAPLFNADVEQPFGSKISRRKTYNETINWTVHRHGRTAYDSRVGYMDRPKSRSNLRRNLDYHRSHCLGNSEYLLSHSSSAA